jgi:hypothetical protein
MKLKRNTPQTAGNALVVTLFMVSILAVSIAGYLSYTNQQTLLGFRAQAWNMAMAISEAGVEEGLQQLNNNWTNLATDGWTANGTVYSITRDLGSGNSYTVSIDYSNAFAPNITARGYSIPPSLAMNTPESLFAVGGVNTTTETPRVSRAIRVQTSKAGLFLASMVARHKIDMNGNDVLTDSFDSADPAKSTGGQYDATKAGDHGDVASNDGVTNTISAGNANIYGKAYVGPGGTMTLGPNGGVGEHSWQATHHGVEDGWFFNNANYTFPTIGIPYNSGLDPGPQDVIEISGQTTTNSTTYTAVATLPTLSAGQTLSPIVTNTSTATSSVYPGSKPGMSTNTTYLTVSTYPGAQPQLVTNYVGFTTTTSHPGPQPQLSTNCSATVLKVKDRPASGWCGQPPWQTGNDVNWWYYNPIAGYTYANQFTYTYASYTYTYTTYTYTYTVYYQTPLYVTNHYDHVLANGDYYTTADLTGTTLVTGTARLVMPNGLKMSGQDKVTIASGGSLTLYSDGPNLTIGGNGMFNNSGYAANLIVYGTDNVKNFTLNGNGTFKGVLVAPEADIRMNGGGSTYEDFIGCLLANSVTMNGHFNFHYDEALGRMNTNGRFLITSWDEIK